MFGEVLGEPKSNVAFLAAAPVVKIVDSLKYEYDLFVDGVAVLEGLVFDALVADIQPIGEILPDLFLVELNFLTDVQVFPQLNQDPVNCIEVVAVIAPGRGEVQDGQISSILNYQESTLGLMDW